MALSPALPTPDAERKQSGAEHDGDDDEHPFAGTSVTAGRIDHDSGEDHPSSVTSSGPIST
jgi:hypothetical protein